ncbi:unnamed protein product [Closterium sp. Yama58-4]|nr:unnamed protein product [Closterium sp. Yama58-4]
MVVTDLGDVNTNHKEAATIGKSMVVAGSGDANNTVDKDAATRVESMVIAGFRDTNTIDRTASASASLVQQQQVAVTSWVAQAELAGLTLPPDLIRESAHAARFAQMQVQVEEQGGMGNVALRPNLENSQLRMEVEQPILAFPERLEEGGCLGITQEEGRMLEVLMLEDGGMQMHGGGIMQEGGLMLDGATMQGFGMMQGGGMRQNISFEVPLKCALQEGQGSVSVNLASAGERTGPGSPCLISPENAWPPASPASTPSPAAAAAAYPHTAFFSPRTPGGFCTPASAGACCSPIATPSACREGEGEQALTLQEPPATWVPRVSSKLVPQWLEVRGVEDVTAVRKEKREVSEAKRNGEEDWRPRIRTRLDGKAAGLGRIQARSMKERHRRDRIRRGLEQLHRALPASLASAQLDTARMVESALKHIKDLQVRIKALENPTDALVMSTPCHEKPSSRYQNV